MALIVDQRVKKFIRNLAKALDRKVPWLEIKRFARYASRVASAKTQPERKKTQPERKSVVGHLHPSEYDVSDIVTQILVSAQYVDVKHFATVTSIWPLLFRKFEDYPEHPELQKNILMFRSLEKELKFSEIGIVFLGCSTASEVSSNSSYLSQFGFVLFQQDNEPVLPSMRHIKYIFILDYKSLHIFRGAKFRLAGALAENRTMELVVNTKQGIAATKIFGRPTICGIDLSHESYNHNSEVIFFG